MDPLATIIQKQHTLTGPQRMVASVGATAASAATTSATAEDFSRFAHQLKDQVQKVRFPASATQAGAATDCTTLEYAGGGPRTTGLNADETEEVKRIFEKSKTQLLHKIEHQKGLAAETRKWMEERLRKLHLLVRPMQEEPDLSWRGMGVLAYDARGNPVVELGGGFARLMNEHPDRARFEITRLVAQSWAPCAMEAEHAAGPWGSYLKCMNISQETGQFGCKTGEFSEAGWAVSSAIAYRVSNPGCRVPAFQDAQAEKCLDGLKSQGF